MQLNPQDRIIHQQFSDYGQNAKEWLRKCAILLPEIERRQIWKKRKCSSIYEYAAKVAGMSRSSVEEALRVLRRIEDKPSLIQLVKEKGIQRVRPLAVIATVETQEFWTEKGKVMSKNALEAYVKSYRLKTLPREASQPEKPARETVHFDVSPQLAKKLQQFSKRADFETLLEKFLESVEVQEQREKPQAVITPSRHIPAKIEKFVQARTNGLCAYLGCQKPATSLHHTQRWALENVHDPDRLHPVCTGHERLAHLGLIENEEQSPENWQLRRKPDRNDPKFIVDSLVSLYRAKR